MQFSLIDPVKKTSLVFPVNPEELRVGLEAKTITFSSIKLGDVDIPQGRMPMKFAWSGLLPGEGQVVPYRHSDVTPDELIEQLTSWNDEESKELRLIITGTKWNIAVFLNNFEAIPAGGYGDVSYTISFSERRKMVVQEKAVKAQARSTPKKPRTHTVKKGDTLWDIAKKITGKGGRWTEMWAINKGKSRSKNPHLIYPGEVFTVPSGW